MKTVVVSQARMGSTRLPGKVLRLAAGRAMLVHHLERLRLCARADEVVVATTELAEDDAIVACCDALGVRTIRGSSDDVLDRYRLAAEVTAADVIVRVTADCPLIDPGEVDRVIAALVDAEGTAAYASNAIERSFPIGLDVEVFTRAALVAAASEAAEPFEREHVTPFIRERPERFAQRRVSCARSLGDRRWTLDTPEDLEFLRQVITAIADRLPRIDWREILVVIDEHPEWRSLNASIAQRHDRPAAPSGSVAIESPASLQQRMTIGAHTVGTGCEPLIIAELSGNHNQSIERALALVDAASASGAHAIKIQTYTADTITIASDRPEFRISDPDSPWYGRTLHDLYQEAHTPWDWHAPIFARCREHGLPVFSTPFDPTAVDFLEELGAPCYKIASFELVDLPLIRRVAATGKPLIMSTGMGARGEIADAVTAAREAGCRELVLLACTSSYPADPAESHLRRIPELARIFGCPVGLSDHTLGIGAAVAAVALGACVIEKHLTLRRADGGPDAAFSLEPEEMRQLVDETAIAHAALGTTRFGAGAAERTSSGQRRSLYVVADVPAGTTITEAHVRSIRPGNGLPPRYLEHVLGRRAACDLTRGTPLAWRHLAEA